MGDMVVCKDCGWFDDFKHKEHMRCQPRGGAAARKLFGLLKPLKDSLRIALTMLGYGTGRVAVEFGEDETLVLNVYANGTFGIDHVFGFSGLTPEQVGRLVESLASMKSTPKE